MVADAGADIVDINFGCPVRKVTKTGAGATLLEDPDRAARIVEAVASAVDAAGLGEDAPRHRERLARLPRARAAPRGRRRGVAHAAPALGAPDVHRHGRPLADRRARRRCVDVPVIASGDVTSRARAQAVLATTGAAAVMVGRAAQGNPWALREILDEDAPEPTREEVVAELILFIRETVRELGEQRAIGLPEEVLRLVPRPRPLPAAVQAGARPARRRPSEVELRLLAAAPGAREVLERLEAELPDGDEVLLDLPISIYGGG